MASPLPTDNDDADMWKIKAISWHKRNEILVSELEEAESDIQLLREEVAAALQDRAETEKHIARLP